MIDIWRKENPHRNIFTYHDNNQSIHSRIDRFYINKTQKIQNISITPNNLSDHEGLILTLLIKKSNISGSGYWKLNTSILKRTNKQAINQIENDKSPGIDGIPI